MITLGVILIILGLIFKVGVLFTVGVVLGVVGGFLYLGHVINGGRRWY